MNIVPIRAFVDNYIWLLIKENQAIAIDPGESKPVLAYLKEQGLTLTNIFLTHHHQDHIGGVEALVQSYQEVTVWGPKDERIFFPLQVVEEGSSLSILGFSFEVFAIPGHTSTHIAFYQKKQGWLFCGDTLFSGGCGRVFDGTYAQLYSSLQRLQSLPQKTKIYCAHEYTRNNLAFARTIEPQNHYLLTLIEELQKHPATCTLPSTIEREQEINPFFRIHLPSIQQYAKEKGHTSQDPFSLFTLLREEKNLW